MHVRVRTKMTYNKIGLPIFWIYSRYVVQLIPLSNKAWKSTTDRHLGHSVSTKHREMSKYMKV
jgi:hypothetical protein